MPDLGTAMTLPPNAPGQDDRKSDPHRRTPPHNFEAEQALLGAILHNNMTYEKVSDFLKPVHFTHPAHGKIYEAIGRLIERNQIADPITLKDYFDSRQELKELGGKEYLIELATAVASIINATDYAHLIHDLYLKRSLIDIGEDVVNEAFEPALDLNGIQLIEGAEQRLYQLITSDQTSKGFIPFSDALEEAILRAENAFKKQHHVVGVTSGLTDLDKCLGGLHPSDLLILAGRPSMGKTALATNIAFNAAKAVLDEKKGGGIVAFFSLEMSAEQLAARLLSQETGIPSDRIRRGDIDERGFNKFVDVSRTISALPLYIDDTPALSISAVRNRSRRLKRKYGLDLIVIDYLQLLQGSPDGRRNDGRVNEISEITRGLKALAKELNVPVLALSQLSRAVEQRDDKRPQLSDLRESGSIEQDADVVTFVFREEYYESRKEPPVGSEKHAEWQSRMGQIHNVAEVIIAKQRHGPIGTIKLFFDGALTKFADFVDGDHLPTHRP